MKLGSVFILFVALSPYFCYGKNINISEIKNAINLCNGDVIDKRTQTSLKQTIQHHYDNDGYVFYQIMNISSRSGDIIAITQDYSFPNHIIGFIVKKNSNAGIFDVIALCQKGKCIKYRDLIITKTHVNTYKDDNANVSTCNTEDRANRTAEMLSKALHVKFFK